MKIQDENGEREIKLIPLKGRETKKGVNLLLETKKVIDDEDKQIDKLKEYTDYLEKLTAQHCGMTLAQLDDLTNSEKNKLVTYFQNEIMAYWDFLKSSLKQQGLSETKTD